MMLGTRQYNLHNKCPKKSSLYVQPDSQIVDFFKSHMGRWFPEKVRFACKSHSPVKEAEKPFSSCFCFQGSVIQERNYKGVWRILRESICIICCTFCYIQMNEYYQQGKGLACFLKWPHKGAFGFFWLLLLNSKI